jgi:demethylmenaquinone methyltransferase/2-methoxy-6-polyprenyl-1,4-benzoquinol methylase
LTVTPTETQSRSRAWERDRSASFGWENQDRRAVVERYDRLAGLIPLFDWLLFQPPGFRRKAVERLELAPGSSALEIGCGTGRNIAHLRRAVGPSGQVYGVDISPGMLARARDLRDRRCWSNVTLVECDAADYGAPVPLDGVLFGLSYNTMPHHLAVLRNAWQQLRPGGRLVIMDAKLPPGLGGEIVLPFGLWLMKRTMLGNPYIRPWEDLAKLTDDFAMEEFMLGSYYICCGTKP